MNRWQVYEFIKQRYMRTGYLPLIDEIAMHFPAIDEEELAEGVEEFLQVIEIQHEGGDPNVSADFARH